MYVEDDGHTAPIEKEIRALSQALEAVKDEQEYIVVRERLHRDTAESTNDRVKWWSIIQTVVVFAVCGWQIFYLKRSARALRPGRSDRDQGADAVLVCARRFFEVKRTV